MTTPAPLPTIARAYRGAYATALLGSLVSAGLTYVFVGNGAHELNPVVRALIAAAGLETMVFFKTIVVVVAFHGYAWLVPAVSPRIVVAFAWLGSLVNAADALHNVGVALRVGVPASANVVTCTVLVLLSAALGVALRPRASTFR